MRDLTRDEMQDLLPELLHGRLSGDVAAAIERTVAADPDLAAELAMLRAVHAASARMPAIDVARIVAALPLPPEVVATTSVVDDLAERRAAKRVMHVSRFVRAAAVVLVIGGGTLIALSNGPSPTSPTLATNTTSESVAVASGVMQLGLGASTDELSVEQLRALEADIRSLDGVPSADVDTGIDFLAGEGA